MHGLERGSDDPCPSGGVEAVCEQVRLVETPDEAVARPERVIAQVMNIGDYADVQALVAEIGEDVLREVLARAEAGQFNERSWAYWHYRLGVSELGQVPAPPTRRLP